jgi:hypothetical protein
MEAVQEGCEEEGRAGEQLVGFICPSSNPTVLSVLRKGAAKRTHPRTTFKGGGAKLCALVLAPLTPVHARAASLFRARASFLGGEYRKLQTESTPRASAAAPSLPAALAKAGSRIVCCALCCASALREAGTDAPVRQTAARAGAAAGAAATATSGTGMQSRCPAGRSASRKETAAPPPGAHPPPGGCAGRAAAVAGRGWPQERAITPRAAGAAARGAAPVRAPFSPHSSPGTRSLCYTAPLLFPWHKKLHGSLILAALFLPAHRSSCASAPS